jgi:hypothetical protein
LFKKNYGRNLRDFQKKKYWEWEFHREGYCEEKVRRDQKWREEHYINKAYCLEEECWEKREHLEEECWKEAFMENLEMIYEYNDEITIKNWAGYYIGDNEEDVEENYNNYENSYKDFDECLSFENDKWFGLRLSSFVSVIYRFDYKYSDKIEINLDRLRILLKLNSLFFFFFGKKKKFQLSNLKIKFGTNVYMFFILYLKFYSNFKYCRSYSFNKRVIISLFNVYIFFLNEWV